MLVYLKGLFTYLYKKTKHVYVVQIFKSIYVKGINKMSV